MALFEQRFLRGIDFECSMTAGSALHDLRGRSSANSHKISELVKVSERTTSSNVSYNFRISGEQRVEERRKRLCITEIQV